MTDQITALQDRIKELEKENEGLLDKIADPKLISMCVDERGAEIAVKPREEIMRHLFLLCAHAMGESKNFVECEFGPDDEGRWYVVTLRNYHGKTPGQIHDEQIKKLEDRIRELERQ